MNKKRDPRQAFIFYPGKYYVKYRPNEDLRYPGGDSMCMTKNTAKEYAKMFDGTVHRHPAYPTMWEKIKRIMKYLIGERNEK